MPLLLSLEGPPLTPTIREEGRHLLLDLVLSVGPIADSTVDDPKLGRMDALVFLVDQAFGVRFDFPMEPDARIYLDFDFEGHAGTRVKRAVEGRKFFGLPPAFEEGRGRYVNRLLGQVAESIGEPRSHCDFIHFTAMGLRAWTRFTRIEADLA